MQSLFCSSRPTVKDSICDLEISRALLLEKLINTKWDSKHIVPMTEGKRYSKPELIYKLIEKRNIERLKELPCSVKVLNVQQYIPEIKRACLKQFKQTGIAVTCNAYITPGKDKNALPFHIDPQDTAIFQVHGEKEWVFCQKEGELLFQTKWDEKAVEDSEKLNIKTQEGQWLSIPYCLPHRANAINSVLSIHLTFATIIHFRDSFRTFLETKGIEVDDNWAERGLEKLTAQSLDKWAKEATKGPDLQSQLKSEFMKLVQKDSLAIMKYGRSYIENPIRTLP